MGNIASRNVGNRTPERPPVSKGRLIGEALAAVAAMAAVGGVSLVIFVPAYSRTFGANFCMGGLVGLGLWISVVCPVVLPPASAITVYLIGRIGDQTGSFWATLGLSVLGGFLAMLAFFVPDGIMFSPVLIPLGSSLGAVMGFNLTRRYKETFAAKNVARKNVARKDPAQKDFFQLVKEFESKTSQSHSAGFKGPERQ